MYQPDTIKFFKLNNQPYLVTMNEGDAKDYASWSEEMRGQNFLLSKWNLFIHDKFSLVLEKE